MDLPDYEHLTGEETSLPQRVDAVADFIGLARQLINPGDLKWTDAAADYRLLAINAALRRQLESIDAACLLCRNGLGHLAVAFVRASVEDIIYLDFLCPCKWLSHRSCSYCSGIGITCGPCLPSASTSVTRL